MLTHFFRPTCPSSCCCPPVAVDLNEARRHHDALEQVLEERCGLQVLALPSGGFADSVFIEDTLVAVAGVALLTRPGAPVSSSCLCSLSAMCVCQFVVSGVSLLQS